jgi:hypothetical protein
MNRSTKLLIGSVIVLAAIGAAWWWRGRQPGRLVHDVAAPQQPGRPAAAPAQTSSRAPAPASPNPAPIPAQPVAGPLASETPPAPAPELLPSSPKIKTQNPKPEAKSAPPPSPAVSSSSATEIVGTARMLAAHVPLRAPAVANPDSPQNRAILQTMVAKALARSRSTAPAIAR